MFNIQLLHNRYGAQMYEYLIFLLHYFLSNHNRAKILNLILPMMRW